MLQSLKFISLVLGGLFLLHTPHAKAAPRFESQIRSALSFIAANQTSGRDGYEPGQWRARVTSYVPSPIGVGRFGEAFEEPTAFVAASVANVLAEIYIHDSSYQQIPALLLKAEEGLTPFRWGSLFNFYPFKISNGMRIRAPRYMYLAPKWKGFTNIPPDADTTSVTYIFLHYLESIQSNLPPGVIERPLPHQVMAALSSARDQYRKPHVYNASQGHKETGAFLTWLYDEKNPNMPRNIFAAPTKGTRIPFNFNDVDCVVNANVLKLLTYANATHGPGYKASCDHLNKVVRQKQFYFCGMYYPSSYALPYAIAANLQAGTECLEPSKDRVLNYILSKQKTNGSWQNSVLARPDFIQSTVWALNTVLILGDPQNATHRAQVRKGIHFLLSQAQRDSEGRIFWSGQVFFSATFIARYPIVWRSTAYTTALAAKALVLADPYFK